MIDSSQYTHSPWSNRISPCTECDFVGELDDYGHSLDACPKCGARRHPTGRVGRFIYELRPYRWFPLVRRKIFAAVEWRRDTLELSGGVTQIRVQP